MPHLELRDVYKRYPKASEYTVTGFNLAIEKGEFVVFVGPSGCGKSTTLRMIAGLEEISSGGFYKDGVLQNDIPPQNRDIAMVFQNYALYPHMSVFDNIAFTLKMNKVPAADIEKRVNRVLEKMELSAFAKKKPGSLSGGQKQRVALGRAIVRDASLFLMDEPLSNLDAKLRVQMRAEISDLHKEIGGTTIYVTHDQTEAMTMADRIIIMDAGVIQQAGAPFDIYHKPENTFVARFIGSPSMNLIDGKFSDGFFISGKLRIELSEEDALILLNNGYNGKELIYGIRPENISVSGTGSNRASVKRSELLGSESLLNIDFCGHDIELKQSDIFGIKAGDDIKISLNKNNAHFFDSESKKRIF